MVQSLYPNLPDPSQQTMSMQVQLYISCRRLKDLDIFSKSDPKCRIYEQNPLNGTWRMVA
jgi:hypothetical protein